MMTKMAKPHAAHPGFLIHTPAMYRVMDHKIPNVSDNEAARSATRHLELPELREDQ
jgi:hypothetical protein